MSLSSINILYPDLCWINVSERLPTDYENLQSATYTWKFPQRALYVVQVDHKNNNLIWPCYFDFINKTFYRLSNNNKIGKIVRWAKLPTVHKHGPRKIKESIK